MPNYQVKCHTPDDQDLDRRIQGLGGDWGWFPIDAIIRMIENGGDFFWAYVEGHPTAVVVRQPIGEKKYLTTHPDQFPPNNLLSLPRCPGR